LFLMQWESKVVDRLEEGEAFDSLQIVSPVEGVGEEEERFEVGRATVGVVGGVGEGEGGTPLDPPQDDPPYLIPEAAGRSLAQRMARARAYALGEPIPE